MTKLEANLGLTPELLGLTDIQIEAIRLSHHNTFHIKVSSTKEKTPCRKCGNSTESYGYGRTLHLRHLPILGREVYIEITPSRGICKHCDGQPTTTQVLDWFERNGHHTRPYEDYLMRQLIGSTLTDVAKKENLTEEILQGVIDCYQIDEVNWTSIQRIGLLGLDEIALKKGYTDYVTLITSRYQGINKILCVIQGKEKASIKAFLNTIPKNKRKTITAVCVDLCDNYMNAVKEVLDKEIPIVADRFHVSKLYRQEITKLRSSELKRLRKLLRDEEYQALRPAIKILISKQECYTNQDKKILLPLFKLSPVIKATYKLARELTHIYNRHQRKSTAQVQIKEWIRKVETRDIKCFDEFIQTLQKYEEPISNYFIKRNSSGWIEGINNKVKLIKRRCYGITVLKHFFQRIFLDLQGYDIFLNKQFINATELQHKIR